MEEIFIPEQCAKLFKIPEEEQNRIAEVLAESLKERLTELFEDALQIIRESGSGTMTVSDFKEAIERSHIKGSCYEKLFEEAELEEACSRVNKSLNYDSFSKMIDHRAYYKKIVTAVMTDDHSALRKIRSDLMKKSDFCKLAPSLVKFLSEARQTATQYYQLKNALIIVNSLFVNPKVFPCVEYRDEAIDAFLNFISDKRLLQADVRHWNIKRISAKFLTNFVKKVANQHNKLIIKTLRKLEMVIIDRSQPLSSHFGAFLAVHYMGKWALREILRKHLSQYFEYLNSILSGNNQNLIQDTQIILNCLFAISTSMLKDIHKAITRKKEKKIDTTHDETLWKDIHDKCHAFFGKVFTERMQQLLAQQNARSRNKKRKHDQGSRGNVEMKHKKRKTEMEDKKGEKKYEKQADKEVEERESKDSSKEKQKNIIQGKSKEVGDIDKGKEKPESLVATNDGLKLGGKETGFVDKSKEDEKERKPNENHEVEETMKSKEVSEMKENRITSIEHTSGNKVKSLAVDEGKRMDKKQEKDVEMIDLSSDEESDYEESLSLKEKGSEDEVDLDQDEEEKEVPVKVQEKSEEMFTDGKEIADNKLNAGVVEIETGKGIADYKFEEKSQEIVELKGREEIEREIGCNKQEENEKGIKLDEIEEGEMVDEEDEEQETVNAENELECKEEKLDTSENWETDSDSSQGENKEIGAEQSEKIREIVDKKEIQLSETVKKTVNEMVVEVEQSEKIREIVDKKEEESKKEIQLSETVKKTVNEMVVEVEQSENIWEIVDKKQEESKKEIQLSETVKKTVNEMVIEVEQSEANEIGVEIKGEKSMTLVVGDGSEKCKSDSKQEKNQNVVEVKDTEEIEKEIVHEECKEENSKEEYQDDEENKKDQLEETVCNEKTGKGKNN